MITSLDSNKTYIGSTNDQYKRLKNHNSSKGAKYTKGQIWIPIVLISGFKNKYECLSFEAGWKKLAKKRSNKRFDIINNFANNKLEYLSDTKWNRIMDLVYFVNHFTMIGTHFKMNNLWKYPINSPDKLFIEIIWQDWVNELPWPYFCEISF